MHSPDQCEKWLKIAANLRVDHMDKSAAELVHELDADGHLALNAPACPAEASESKRMLTRRQGADRLKRQHMAMFNYLGPEAREIIEEVDRINMMNKMEKPGRACGRTYSVNPVHPVSSSGVKEIIGKFGGADQLRNAANKLQSLLRAA